MPIDVQYLENDFIPWWNYCSWPSLVIPIKWLIGEYNLAVMGEPLIFLNQNVHFNPSVADVKLICCPHQGQPGSLGAGHAVPLGPGTGECRTRGSVEAGGRHDRERQERPGR